MAPCSAAAVLAAALLCCCTASMAAPSDTTTACPKNIKPAKPGAGAASGKGFYTTKYDNVNVDMILHNERLFKNYMECLLDRAPCSREGQLLKEIIPDALQSECSRCSEKQKQIAGHIMSYLLQYKKHYWDQLLCKYDPEGKFREKYEVDEEEEDDE